MSLIDSISKPENAAAVWAAIAATFSAGAAFLSWSAQIATLRHTFRPELHFSGWQRIKRVNPEGDLLVFSQITNSGRDSARQVIVNAMEIVDDQRPLYFMGTINIPALAAGETATVNGEISLHWKNAPKNLGSGRTMSVRIEAWCWDALNVRHRTTLSLMLMDDPNAPVGNAARLAAGAYFIHHTAVSEPVWRLKLRRSLARLPIVGRLWRDDA